MRDFETVPGDLLRLARPQPRPAADGAESERVRTELGRRTSFESRLVVLGHVQRGGPPTPADRLLGSRFGVAAVDAVHDGASGIVTALSGDEGEAGLARRGYLGHTARPQAAPPRGPSAPGVMPDEP